jgi:sugar transferase (PEP-CTERM system associated)
MAPVESERFQIPNKVLLLLADTCLILLSLILATLLPSFPKFERWNQLVQVEMLGRFAFVIATFTLGLHYSGLYSFSVTTRWRELVVRSLRGVGVAYLVLALGYACLPHSSLGGKTTALAMALILFGVLGGRLLLGRTQAPRNRMERVLVLGTGAVGRQIADAVQSATDLDMEIVGFLDEQSKNTRLSTWDDRVIGQALDVEKIVRREKIERVVVALSERRGRMPVQQLVRLKLAGVKVEDGHSVYEQLTGRIHLERLTPSWLFMSSGFRNNGLRVRIKYLLDFIVALILLVVFAPVMVLVALAIWIETGRPILFIQDRVGRHGRQFRIYKFRSMHQKSDSTEVRWTTHKDDRVTRVGKVIRKYRLDELPQLFNVLRGDMSVVGPRPEQPYFCQELGQRVPYYAERHSVRPGITGWAQVKFHYGGTVDDSKTKLEYDLFYLKHMSPWLDMVILLYTINVLLSGKGAR